MEDGARTPVLLHGDFDLTEAEQERRELKHLLAAEVRRLAELVTLVDGRRAGPADVYAALDGVRSVSAALAALPAHPTGLNDAPTWEAALTERSPITGRCNPVAAPLVVRADGARTVGHAVYTFSHEGPRGHVHGGVVMGAFDELLGIAQAASGQSGYTGTLTVRMRRLTPLHERIDYEAAVDRVDGRKIIVWGRSWARGELLCEAEGVFIAPADRTHVEGGGTSRPPG